MRFFCSLVRFGFAFGSAEAPRGVLDRPRPGASDPERRRAVCVFVTYFGALLLLLRVLFKSILKQQTKLEMKIMNILNSIILNDRIVLIS